MRSNSLHLRLGAKGETMKSVLTWCTIPLLATAMLAQDAGTMQPKKKPVKKAVPAVTTADVQSLRDAIAAQQQQIEQLKQALTQRDQASQQAAQQAQQAQSTATDAQSKADQAAAQTSQQQEVVTALKSDVADIKQNSTNTALSLQETQKNITDALESPLALHFKGITLTPGGFMAAETVWRQKALASDINTPFNSVPFGASSQSDL